MTLDVQYNVGNQSDNIAKSQNLCKNSAYLNATPNTSRFHHKIFYGRSKREREKRKISENHFSKQVGKKADRQQNGNLTWISTRF